MSYFLCRCGVQVQSAAREKHQCNGSSLPIDPDQDVNHPKHYTSHPSGVECIDVVEHLSFNVGNAIKYLWRAGLKSDDAITDLKKARWYADREIDRLRKMKP